MAIRTPPSQSAPLPAPPQGEPRPGPRTPPTLASPLGGGAPAGGGEGPHPPFCHCEERSDVAIRPPSSCHCEEGQSPDVAIRPPYLAKFYIICYNPSKRCQWR